MDLRSSSFDDIVKKTCLFSNILYILCHLFYLIFFLILGKNVMVYINIFSVCFYLLLFLTIKYKKYNTFVVCCGVEIPIYMTSATMLCGFEAGFQLCLIGLCVLAFYVGYFSQVGHNFFKPIPVSLAYMGLFIFVYFYLKYNNPYYVLSNEVYVGLFVAHTLITFAFVIMFMHILIRYILKLERKILAESETDRLTQVANRNSLARYFESLDDHKNKYVAAMFDIDNFKEFNDVNGHLCGDYVLQEIARIAKENSLDDFVARFGGEEFVVISKIENTMEDTIKKLDQIRIKIDEYGFQYNNKTLHSTITIGVAEYVEGDTLDSWISRADEKLYIGKNSGKNKISY